MIETSCETAMVCVAGIQNGHFYILQKMENKFHNYDRISLYFNKSLKRYFQI